MEISVLKTSEKVIKRQDPKDQSKGPKNRNSNSKKIK